MEFHFFDVDHTIIPGASGIDYMLKGLFKRIFPLTPILAIPFMLSKYKKGHLSLDMIFDKGIPFLKGIKRETLELLSNEVFIKKTKNKIFTKVDTLIRELKNKGSKIILSTSSVDIIIQPLAVYLEADDMICSRFQFENSRCTGLFEGIPVFGEEKKRLTLEYMKNHNLNPRDVYFYSDSINDMPLLEAVGHPVIINPDKLLKKEAIYRGWEIFPVG